MLDENLKKEIKQLVDELRQQDSLEIGNSKTGVFKVYFNVDKFEEAKLKVAHMKELLSLAKEGIL